MKRKWRGVVATRLIIVALISLVLWTMAPGIVHHQLSSLLREATGMEWQFEIARFDWANRRISLSNVTIESADGLARKSVYAESGSIDIRDWGLASRSMVISKLKLQGARSVGMGDALLPSWMFQETTRAPDPVSVTGRRQAKNAALAWLDATQIRVLDIGPFESLSETAIREIGPDWQGELKKQTERLQEIENKLATAASQAKKANEIAAGSDNPLRDEKVTVLSSISLQQMNELAASARSSVDELVEIQNRFVARLNKTLEEDISRATAPPPPTSFHSDNGLASRALACQFGYQAAAQLTAWAKELPGRWTSAVPAEKPETGLVVFHGSTLRPQLTIERIEIDGIAIVSGSHFDYILSMDHLSDLPEANDRPFSFSLRGQGSSPVLLTGKVAKPGVVELELSITNQPVGLLSLGEDSVFGATARGGNSSIQARLTIDESGCDGQAELFHEFETIELVSLHSLLGNRVNMDRLKAGLVAKKAFSTSIAFSSCSDELVTALTSDFGETINQLLQQSLNPPASAVTSGRIDELSIECSRTRAAITSGLEEIRNRVQKIIEQHGATVAEFKSTEIPASANQDRLPGIRR